MAADSRKGEPGRAEGLTVITTHVNADFDAFASMLAAQKLYPNALAVFPGSQETSLRNFFIQSMVYLFNLVNFSDIDLNEVQTLVLVDTRQPGRIGRFAEIAGRDGLCVHLFDHHPDAPGDIAGQVEVCRPCGATVTLLTEILKDKGIPITGDEATVMSLGIYEDTGSFTFSSTTREDFLAAAHLVSCGANLNMVASLISREVSPEQITLLNDMIRGTEKHRIHGIEVAVCTVGYDDYVNDFAFLVHKLQKMENLDALFAIARMGNRITVVARSRIPEVDAGKILAGIGGGGHPYAASATIKDQPLVQVEETVLGLLHRKIKPRQKARDIMSHPVIRADKDLSIREAGRQMTQYNVNALVVTEARDGEARLTGIISRQVVEKALHHHLDEVPIAEYMTTDPVTVTPDAGIMEIQEKVLEAKQRLLPVMEGREIVGVITRTDLLNILVNESYRMPEPAGGDKIGRERTRKVVKLMQDRLPKALLERIRLLGRIADQAGVEAFVVGGFVRDLFLNYRNLDVDIVVEGDGIEYARAVSRAVGGRLHAHGTFGTAVVVFPDGFKLDVASARTEYYDEPGSLPIVETSSLKMDLYRRDFTVNTMVVRINESDFGTLIDFFGAQRDIKAKSIQVLHNLSFVEDPTRVFRAIRFETRFGFTIGKLTSGLIENAVKMEFFKRLSGRRLFTELRLILSEDNPIHAVCRMDEFDLLAVIHPALSCDERLRERFVSAKRVIDWYDLLFIDDSYMKWAVNFLILIHELTPKQAESLGEKLEFPQKLEKVFVKERRDGRYRLKTLERRKQMRNSEIYETLKPLSVEMLLYMMGAAEREITRERISLFIRRLNGVKTALTGQDLKNLGVKPGPVFKEILEAVLAARLDGQVETKDDEIALAKSLLA